MNLNYIKQKLLFIKTVIMDPTSQTGQTHSNNSTTADCLSIIWKFLTILWGLHLKG